MEAKITIKGPALPNIPWEERPEGAKGAAWRYSGNPIIKRDATARSNSIFNSAVVPFEGGFAGVFRIDDTARRMNLHRGLSKDGIHWEIDDDPIQFIPASKDQPASEYKYDPRVVWIEDRFYIVWCDGNHGASLGFGYTKDFKTFQRMENIFPPYNRNGVPFPRKINGKYAILHRPSDSGHTPFGDIFYSESPDLEYWGKHRWVMGTRGSDSGWQSTKIGAGAVPIETSDGWLLFYHGVLNSCNGFVYSMSACILDIDEPWKVKYRARHYLISPQRDYECVGDVPNVVFPCASLQDPASGRIALYYGGADTVVNLAFTTVDEVVAFVKGDSI
jgi:beta-1,4-mannooligosaccharide/beta-1,4-mannosyl-N-acetylglucosamine phosphorylase